MLTEMSLMRDSGRMISNTVLASIYLQMEMFMKGLLITVTEVEAEHTNGQMEKYIMDNGTIIRW